MGIGRLANVDMGWLGPTPPRFGDYKDRQDQSLLQSSQTSKAF